MLKKENNQLVDITNISESLNIQRDTRQYSEQTKALVPLNNPLGSTHVTHTVSNNDVCYIGDHTELIKKPESTPKKLNKRTTDNICEINDQNRSISSFPLVGTTSEIDSLYSTGNIGQDFEQGSTLEIDKDVEEQLESDYQLAKMRKIHPQKNKTNSAASRRN